MKKQVDWNINNYVTVELCDYGVEVYTSYLQSFYGFVRKQENTDTLVDAKVSELHKNNNILRLQGWDMLSIFGEHLYLGSRPIFKECNWKVEIEE